MQIVAKCPKCDASLPVDAGDAPAVVRCGACAREIPLAISEAVGSGGGGPTVSVAAAVTDPVLLEAVTV